MDKSVIISIKGVQSTDGEQPEVIELVTEGKLLDCGDAGYTLTYQESQLTGLEGTLTTGAGDADAGGGVQLPDGLSARPAALLHVRDPLRCPVRGHQHQEDAR